MKMITSRHYPIHFLLVIIFIFSVNTYSQTTEDALFNSALQDYVQKLMTRFSMTTIEHERFLVQQIRMLNREIKSRVKNIPSIRENYFDKLQNQLNEIAALKTRLAASGSSSLNVFIDQLEKKIQDTIDSGIINFKRQKAIAEAVQLLHIGEEMISLDPNAELEKDPEFSKNFRETRSEFLKSFGLAAKPGPETAADIVNPTIFNVYKEWKSNELLKYQVRWTDVQIIKNRLIKKGNISDTEKMFKRELEQAVQAFNFEFYDLAERSFEEILKRYAKLGRLDDCLYLKGQSNYSLGRYNKAKKDFEKFTAEYPASDYLQKAYIRLMQINYHFVQYDQVISLYQRFRSIVAGGAEGMDRAAFMALVSALKAERFNDGIELVFEIPKISGYYLESRFVLAESYAGIRNYEQAKKVFNDLIADYKSIDPNFRFLILLKLGYISYEQSEYFNAIRNFDLIAGNFSQYDRVLIGYAWAHYKNELARPENETKDFSLARKHLEILLDNFYASDYILEANALLGYINQLDERVDEALSNFSYTFNAKEVKKLSDELNVERDGISDAMKTAERLQRKALEKNDSQAFMQAYDVSKKIRLPLQQLNYMDLSSSGVALSSEVTQLKNQANELDRLKEAAQQRQNKELVKRIEKLQLKIFRAINTLPEEGPSKLGLNYFDEHPLARKVSVIENNNDKLKSLRENSRLQREDIQLKITQLDIQINDARSSRDFKKLVRLELSKERFLALADKFDFMETSSYAMNYEASNIDLNRWADYSAFGMTNVRFDVKAKKDKEIANIQQQINQINEFLEIRKTNIEHKISEINDQITLMTRRVRKQERLREREELKRQFNESYFDTRDTEMDYENTTEPPKIED